VVVVTGTRMFLNSDVAAAGMRVFSGTREPHWMSGKPPEAEA